MSAAPLPPVAGGQVVSVYLDTNAVLDLFPRTDTDASREMRRVLKLRVRQQRLRYLAADAVLLELARYSENEWPRYRRVVRYLHELAHGRILLDPLLLIAAEVRRGGALPMSARVYRRRHAREIWRRVMRREWIGEARQEAKSIALQHETTEKAARRGFLEHVDRTRTSASSTIELRKWWETRGARAIVHDFATPVTPIAAAMGITVPADYPIERIPTLWRWETYYVARTFLRNSENRKIKSSDFSDTFHYALGGCADVFVSSDGPMEEAHRTAAGATDVNLVSLRAFAASYLDD